MSVLGPDGKPITDQNVCVPSMRAPSLLDVLRAINAITMKLQQLEAVGIESNMAIGVLVDKGIITPEELQAKYDAQVTEKLAEGEQGKQPKEEE